QQAIGTDRVRVPQADALGQAAVFGDVAIHRLAPGNRITDFETGAAVRLRTPEEVEVGQHRVGPLDQGDVVAVDPLRLRGRFGDPGGNLLVQREQAFEAVARAERLQLAPTLPCIGAEDIGAGEVDGTDHR